MKLFKNCKKIHNITLACKTLHLGTLYGYRKAENIDIRDEEEGTYNFELAIQDTFTVKFDWWHTLFAPLIRFSNDEVKDIRGDFSAQIHDLQIIKAHNNEVTLAKSLASIKRNAPDQFVFCMSIADKHPPIVSAEYNSHWSMDVNSAEQFASGAAQNLLEKIRENPNLVLGLDTQSLEKISIKYHHGPVEYLSRVLSVQKSDKSEVLFEKMLNMAYIKPESYSAEAEYRFIFEVTDGQYFYPPSSTSVTLDSYFIKTLP